MKPNIFEYLSYREYLKRRLEHLGPKSGLKRRAAESLAVHTTFISQVVLDKADLSLDQAERMNSFLEHSSEEADFFIDLVIHERASDKNLKKRFFEKIQNKQIQRSQIKPRFSKTREIAPSEQEKFYSSHIYSLIHVLSSIPEFQNRKSLSTATGLPPQVVQEAVDFLLNIGVLKAVKNAILPGEEHVHLSKASRHIWRHHANWRMATLQNFEFARPQDLHYSLCFSCSEQDAQRIRESLLSHLKSLSETVAKSKAENAYVYCFDFFKWM